MSVAYEERSREKKTHAFRECEAKRVRGRSRTKPVAAICI